MPVSVEVPETVEDVVGALGGDGAEAFLFFGQDACDGFRERTGDRYAGVLNLAYGYSETFPAYLNITHAAADKGRALAFVCEHVDPSPGMVEALVAAAADRLGVTPTELGHSIWRYESDRGAKA